MPFFAEAAGGEPEGGGDGHCYEQYWTHAARIILSGSRSRSADDAAARPSQLPRRDGDAAHRGHGRQPPAGADGPAGATANAVCSLSIEPMLMLACLDRGSRTLLAVQAADRFGISVLHAGQEQIARAFATKAPVAEKWAGVAWSERDGIPAIDDALACRLRPARRDRRRRPRDRHRRGHRPGDERGRPARLPRRRVPAAGLSAQPADAVADGLDVVAVGVEDEGAVVAGVVDRARAGGAVVGAAGGEGGGVEGVDRASVLRTPKATWAPLTTGRPREWIQKKGFGPMLGLVAEAGGRLGELHQQRDPERLQRRFVEGLAARVVADLDADVVEHRQRAYDRQMASSSRRRALQGARLVHEARLQPAGRRADASSGCSVAGSRVLEVKGRKSGEWRQTPVNPLTFEGERYLVAPRGHTQWVRNMRVSGGGRLARPPQGRGVHRDRGPRGASALRSCAPT